MFAPLTASRFVLLSVASGLALAMAAGSAVGAQEAPTPPGAPSAAPSDLLPPLIPPAPPASPAQDDGEDGEGPAAATVEAEPDEPPPPIPAVWSPVPHDAAGRSAYGLYLTGRYLSARGGEVEGDTRAGAAALVEAHDLVPEQPVLAGQAFTAALLAGDLDAAARLAPTQEDAPPVLTEAGRLVGAVQTFARGDARRASAALKARPVGPPHGIAAVLVQPWIAAAARDWDFALAAPNPTGSDTLTRVLRLQRAQLLEIRRRPDEAEVEYKSLMDGPNSQVGFRVAYGEFLERRRRHDEAVALYDARPAADAMSTNLVAARARAASGGRAPRLPNLRQGAARGLIWGAGVASEIGAPQFAAVYLHLALELAPDDDNRLQLGDTLIRARLEAAGRETLAEIEPSDPALYAMAQAQLGQSLSRAGREDEALDAYRRALDAAPDSAPTALALAGQLVSLERNAEALTLLDGPALERGRTQPAVRFLRGAAYEGLGRLPEAEAELLAAVAAAPDQPMFLNFLGYLWVDQGVKIDEGAALIARAHAAEPDDGNIQDSLGWAQFRQGRFDEAVVTLEEAVGKEPANAEINDHLGDAYWRVGRRREAGFQWARVLTLSPDETQRTSAERKLVEGLPPATPRVVPTPTVTVATVGTPDAS